MSNLIHMTRDSHIFDEIGSLTSMEFMRDARIVCKDGTVRWSAMLLTQWSELARIQVLRHDNFCMDYPLTILLPEVKVEMIQKLLRWSIYGQINVTTEEANEISFVLRSLEARFDFSRDPHNQDYVAQPKKRPKLEEVNQDCVPQPKKLPKLQEINQNYVAEPKKPLKVDDTNLRDETDVEHKVVVKQEAVKRDHSESPEQTVRRKKCKTTGDSSKFENSKAFSCPMCEFYCDSSAHLLEHFCCVHYKNDIMRIWGGEDLSKSCPICGKHLGGKKSSVCRHIGITHGYLNAMPEVSSEVKTLCKERKQHFVKRFGPEVNDELSKVFKDCDVCRQCPFDHSTLGTHIAQIHYPSAILENIDVKSKSCKICSAKIDGRDGGISFCGIQHVLVQHPNVLTSLLPQELVELLENSQDSQSMTYCPVCSGKYKNKYLLRVHLSRTHFKDDILNLSRVGKDMNCPMCSFQPDSYKNKGPILAQHLGLSHAKLEDALPGEMRERLRMPKEGEMLQGDGVEIKNQG